MVLLYYTSIVHFISRLFITYSTSDFLPKHQWLLHYYYSLFHFIILNSLHHHREAKKKSVYDVAVESVRKPLCVPCHSEILSRHCSSKNSFILKVLASPKAPSLTQGTHSGVELHTKVFNPPGVGLPSRTLPSSLKGLGTIYGASPFLTAFQFHHFPLTCPLLRYAPIFCSS